MFQNGAEAIAINGNVASARKTLDTSKPRRAYSQRHDRDTKAPIPLKP